MARIIRDPVLENNIVEAVLNEPGAEARIRALYEDGYLVLLRDFRFDLDYAFLNEIDFDVDGPAEILTKLKKWQRGNVVFDELMSSGWKRQLLNVSRRLTGRRPRKPKTVEQFVFERIFRGDIGRLRHFQQQVRSGDAQTYALFKRIFPGYRDLKQTYTWRFTQTLFENLHWDNFGTTDDFHQVRVFCNIDRRPRIWRTSERFETFIRRVYAEHKLDRYASESPDQFAHLVNNKLLGGMAAACLDGMRANHIAFAQGEVWLCETRLVSHQIYAGHRALAAMFTVAPESMDAPHLRYDAMVKRVHTDFSRAEVAMHS